MKKRCIKIVNPDKIYTKIENNRKEFYFYKDRMGTRKNYRYKVTYVYNAWKDLLNEVDISWNDIIAQKLKIKLFAHGGIEFIKVKEE